MRQLVLSLGLFFTGSLLLACSGTNSPSTVASPDGAVQNAQVQPNNAQNSPNQNQVVSGGNNENGVSSTTSCPQTDYRGFSEPETAAVAKACSDADLKSFDFAPAKNEVKEKTTTTAKVRVVGFSQSCNQYCPGEIQITYPVFINSSGKWEAGDQGAYFGPSDERKAGEKSNKRNTLEGITASISDLHPELNEGNFYTNVTYSKNMDGMFVQLLVDLPNGQKDIIYAAGSTAGLYGDIPGPDGKYQLPYNIFEWNGEKVNIKAYRLIDGYTNAMGDWITVN